MDCSIAFILPGLQAAETVQEYLSQRRLSYPVMAKSTQEAVAAAAELLPHGLRLVISYGLTLLRIGDELPVMTMELPYSGLDTLEAVKLALQAPGNRIVHVGLPHMYHYIQRSLRFLGKDEDLISFCELKRESNQEQRVQEMIDQGFDVFIGGFRVVKYVNQRGKIGIEFNVDELAVETALFNAQSMVSNMQRMEERNELERAILKSSSDGTIVLDPSRHISQINPAALNIFSKPAEELIGRTLEEVLICNKLVNIDLLKRDPQDPPPDIIPVILRELPVEINGAQKGSVVSIKKVSEIQELEYRSRQDLLLKGLIARHSFKDLQGKSPSFLRAKEQAKMYAAYDSPVLLYGETGTGKELFAQSIHNASLRKNQPFVAINCAALSESLIDSELFGYVKGAFTGASKDGKQGLFELANNGTIFLDEISEISISIQSKLLRAIQEGEIIRVGGDKVIRVNTRVICSSNRNLLDLIQEGRFRNDLYYRLCVLEVNIPPLRKRPGDIRLLAEALVHSQSQKHHKQIERISPEVIDFLTQMPFMGNVRELKSVIERMVILADGPVLDITALEKCGIELPEATQPETPRSTFLPPLNIRDAQRQMILNALSQTGGNRSSAARLLGIDPSTLYRKLKVYGISKESFPSES